MEVEKNQKFEKITKPISGYLVLIVLFVIIALIIYGVVVIQKPFVVVLIPVAIFLIPGFFLVNPNGSRVLVLFGKYVGTVKENGFFWVIPFYSKSKISLRARNFETERVKVNDKMGNPILISSILVWKVSDTYKAAFEVDDY